MLYFKAYTAYVFAPVDEHGLDFKDIVAAVEIGLFFYGIHRR